jgi:hypothetical protein
VHAQELQSEWANASFVGLLSAKAALKLGADGDLLQHIESSVAAGSRADVLALLAPGETLRRQAQMTHGAHFVSVFHQTLRQLQLTEQQIIEADQLDMFFCNYWLARPAWLLRYLSFLSAAIDVMTNDAQLQQLLRGDARYREGSQAVAMQVFGTPYYQYHPFICERLPVVFFALHEACVFRRRAHFIPPSLFNYTVLLEHSLDES